MERQIKQRADALLNAKKKRKLWKNAAVTLAAAVVFCTVYALILPAITLSSEPVCELAEHTHGDDCYTEKTVRTQSCAPAHTHTEDCFDEKGNQLCLYAGFWVHAHSDLCYDDTGGLICTLEEREAHDHTDACYTTQLTCGQEESEGHTHTEDCYQLVCAETEEGHSHSENCYEKICGQEESGGHSHTDACYETSLTCGKEEIILHTHSDECYAHPEGQEPYLTCGQIEVQSHEHTDSCFETVSNRELTCTTTEHTHSPECYASEEQETTEQTTAPTVSETEQEPLCGKEEHIHTGECYGPEDGDGEKSLICGKEEHTHDDTCYLLAATEEIVAEEISLFMDSGIMLLADTDSAEQLTLYPGQIYTAAATAEPSTEDNEIVGVKSTPVDTAKLKLGTDAAFTGDTVEIRDALYTFTPNEGGITTTYMVSNKGAYLCLRDGKAGFPQTTNSASIEVKSAGDGTVYLISSSGNFKRYLYFWRDGKNYFDQQQEAADATKFLLYRPAGESEKSSDGIPGYVNVTSVTDNEQYLIAAQYNNDYYVLYPSTSITDKYAHVAKVAPYELTITAKTAGTATVTAGNMTYDVTVTNTIIIERGKTTQIELPESANVTIADNNTASSSIDNDGVVTISGTKVGKTTATVTIGEEIYTWNIQVNAPTSFQLTYEDGPAITFNIVDQNGNPLSAPQAVDVAAESGKRYVFGTAEDSGENVINSFAPAIDGYSYSKAIWHDEENNIDREIFSVATTGYDENTNKWRFYITEPPTDGQYYSKDGPHTVTLYYVPEGAICYDLNLPPMGPSGNQYKGIGWFEAHEPSISATVQELKAGDKLARPAGYYEEPGVAGIPGLYRWRVDYVNELGNTENWKDADGNLPNGTMLDGWYGEGRFDGWTYTADGVTYLLDPEAEFQEAEDGTIFVSASRKIGQDDVIEQISETPVQLPEGARLVGHWTEISNVVSFFINYKGTILDTEGDVTGRRADTFTKSVAVGHVFYGKQKVGVDETFGSDANVLITDAFREKFNKDDPSTQIVVEYLRDCTRAFYGSEGETPQEGINYNTSMSTYSPGANSIMVKNNTLSLLNQTQRTVQVATGKKDMDPTIDPKNCDGDHYEVRWYVLKEQADAWHIDGVLVAKTQEIALTKTFSGLSSDQSKKLMEGTVDGSGNRTDNFQIDTKLGGAAYLTITADSVPGQYNYEGSDSTQQLPNSYHWTLNAIMDEKYTMTEENYKLDGYDVSSIIVHYFKRPNTGVTEVTFEYSNSTSAFEYDYPVTGGHTTAVSFNNFYTPTGTGAMAIVKRDSTSSATDSSGLLEGAEFTLYSNVPSKDDDGNWTGDVAQDSNGKDLIVSTNHNGTAYFSGMIKGGTYYLAETRAPSGYTANGGCWQVVVGENPDTSKVVVTLYEKDTDSTWKGPGQILYDGGITGSYVVKNTAQANTVTVTKTFSGLTAAEMNTLYSSSKTENGSSAGYQIIIGQVDSSGEIGSEEESSAALTLDKAQRSQDGFTFTWTIHDLPITGENRQSINYGLKELNYLVMDSSGSKKYADVAVTGTLAYGNKQELSLNIDVDNTNGGMAETVESFTFHSESSDHIYLNNHYTDTYDVRVNKVGTQGNALEGAVFALYGPYQDSPNSQKFITFTGEDGTAQSYYYIQTLTEGLNGTHTGTGLKFDTDYVLKEVTAPEGYTLAEPILIRDTAENNHDGVYSLEVVNTSKQEATVSVTARKEWANGVPAEEAEVTLNLYRRAGDSGNAVLVNSQKVGAKQDSEKNTIPDTNQYIPGAQVTASAWTVVWENLKAYDDDAVEYQWFVTETSVDGYVTTYSDPMEITEDDTNAFEAGQALGQTNKTVTITNTAGYVLPNTGGNGTAGCLALGGMLMLVSCLSMLCIKKRSKRGGTR